MKTEWHRYNLKRRVANLPAISEDLFNSKVANLTSNTDDIDSKDEEDQKINNEKKKNKTITKKEIRRRQKEELAEKKRQLLELAKQKMLASGGIIKVNDDGKIKLEQNISEEEVKEVEVTEILENVKIEDKLKFHHYRVYFVLKDSHFKVKQLNICLKFMVCIFQKEIILLMNLV
ncbi:unnamed protein product [[Candida] boidinii]|uniref:Unnamed protein product n=1 Tax=Candida boidinii TaxID=5477 RepID=A0ACB5TXL7_CANBO|nr:unnamed protein product [[Candida] boidinii]